MERKDFERALSARSLPRVLLFEGEEEKLKQEALTALRSAILPQGMESLNETVLEDPAGHLMRGYERLEEKLRMLGADAALTIP